MGPMSPATPDRSLRRRLRSCHRHLDSGRDGAVWADCASQRGYLLTQVCGPILVAGLLGFMVNDLAAMLEEFVVRDRLR